MVNSILTKEWHPTKNGDLKSSDVKSKSNKKVWWQCEYGHEWEAIVSNRSAGKKCPFCSGRLPIKGKTDLATVNPVLTKEWHPTKNGNLKPDEVTAQSHKKVWWRCEKGHEWNAIIYSRIKRGCPYCSGQREIKGLTDLSTVNPILAKEWHPTKNGELKPKEVTSQSHKKVWWRCVMGHEWERSVHGRVSNNSGCPYCFGRFAIKGKTDLATVNPILAEEWHSTKNGELKPEDVKVKSHRKVWWQCGEGHEWRAVINARANGTDCPECRRNNRVDNSSKL